MVDSSKWEVLETGLRNIQGKAIVNSISLKEGEAEFLRQWLLAVVGKVLRDLEHFCDTPQRLAALREKFKAWEESLPKHPDASYSVPAAKADLVTPSS